MRWQTNENCFKIFFNFSKQVECEEKKERVWEFFVLPTNECPNLTTFQLKACQSKYLPSRETCNLESCATCRMSRMFCQSWDLVKQATSYNSKQCNPNHVQEISQSEQRPANSVSMIRVRCPPAQRCTSIENFEKKRTTLWKTSQSLVSTGQQHHQICLKLCRDVITKSDRLWLPITFGCRTCEHPTGAGCRRPRSNELRKPVKPNFIIIQSRSL